MEEELAVELCVHGHHIINDVWEFEAAVEEELSRKSYCVDVSHGTTKDRYAVLPGSS